MGTLEDAAIEQLDSLLAEIEPGIERSQRVGASDWFRADDVTQREMRTRAAAAIERLAPRDSPYARDARSLDGKDGYVVSRQAGILRALRHDFATGNLRTLEELIRADVLDDFLEMADELLDKKYADPAAVLAGAVLENHLRKLATRHGVDTEQDGKPIRAARLNDDLARVPVYTKLTQKSVTSWLDLRNSAAHGEFDAYDIAQVESLVREVRLFVDRYPA